MFRFAVRACEGIPHACSYSLLLKCALCASFAILFSLFFVLPFKLILGKCRPAESIQSRGVSAAPVPDAKGAPVTFSVGIRSNGVFLKSIDAGKRRQRLHVTGGES